MTTPDTGAWTPEQFIDVILTATAAAGQCARRPSDRQTLDAIEHAYQLMTLFGVPAADVPDELDGTPPVACRLDGTPLPAGSTGSTYRLDTTNATTGTVYAVTYGEYADDDAALAAGHRQLTGTSPDQEVRIYAHHRLGGTRLAWIAAHTADLE